MDIIKKLSNKMFFVVLVFLIIFAGSVYAGLYYKLYEFEKYVIAGISGYFLVLGLVLFLIINIMVKKSANKIISEISEETKQDKPVKKQVSKKETISRDQKMYLNVLSLLQREGRLIDFFSESLDDFEDQQIGVAVRSVHESCKKALERSFGLKPVLDKPEGEEVTVTYNDDLSSIKLTGNVQGEPPFTGILKHRGWQAGKLELPEFSGDDNSKTIAPAEIEIK